MKKRMLAVILLLAMALTLCACGRKTKAVEETPAPAPVETPEPTPDPAEKIAAAAAKFNAGDYSAAMTELKTLEALGDPEVAWLLGKSFYEGLGTRTDGARAAEYLQSAASNGVTAARFLLADAADNGSGVRQDKDEASRGYVKFAALADELQPSAPGYGSAMVGLTQCYARGLGVEKNQKFAVEAAKKAADAEGLTPFDLMTLAAFFDSADTIKITANADARRSIPGPSTASALWPRPATCARRSCWATSTSTLWAARSATTPGRWSCTPRPARPDTPPRRRGSATCTRTRWACPRTTTWRWSGTTAPPSRATPRARSRSATCIRRVWA